MFDKAVHYQPHFKKLMSLIANEVNFFHVFIGHLNFFSKVQLIPYGLFFYLAVL